MTELRRLAVLIVLALAGCATAPVEEVAETPAPPPSQPEAVAPAPPVPPPPEKRKIKLSIAAVGDMMLGTDFPENHLPDDDGVSFLAAVTPALAAADIAFGNLEGVLVDGGEPAKKCSNPSACYLFRSPTHYAAYFRDAGFDVLSLANNHARDFGEEGRSSTMAALAAVDIHHSGREGDFASFEAKGLRIAVLAYAVTKESNMMLDYDLAEATVREFAASHDVVIVTFHGGAEGVDAVNLPFAEEEYYGEPRGDVVLFARRMVDAGADLLLGHGPHVVRAMENYKDRLIAYSLGNFATYYGISVAGIKGIAPILVATLDGDGRFVEGQIISTVQIRPAGPSIDEQQRALHLMRGLSAEDFGNPGIKFLPDGMIVPIDRPMPTPSLWGIR
ncbi:MAG: CapA family protein [Woeseiaceae bacterium]|nr:CapA family protein [Woeseiaceae bacterium]